MGVKKRLSTLWENFVFIKRNILGYTIIDFFFESHLNIRNFFCDVLNMQIVQRKLFQ